MAKQRKAKTNRAAAKRFHLTATGKIKRKKAGMRHFMRRRSVRAKRNLRNRGYVDKSNMKFVMGLLPNG
ncbi:MAG TPA: 50S ribosomal protein L35 [bacterium]|nr:50S ribosomal protein L35 [bacterium]